LERVGRSRNKRHNIDFRESCTLADPWINQIDNRNPFLVVDDALCGPSEKVKEQVKKKKKKISEAPTRRDKSCQAYCSDIVVKTVDELVDNLPSGVLQF
jgi:hypothetical protein